MPDHARFIRPGEMLAMATSHLYASPQGFFWMLGPSAVPNQRRGSVAIVNIRGGLDHHADSHSDNYEAIYQRIIEAKGEATDEDGDEPEAESDPPDTVMLAIDSPGGVVSGLNEFVAKLRALFPKRGGPRLVAYVNQMAASAAYAIACGCHEIIAPREAIVGSVGVISTMASQAGADKKMGLDYRLITSGARKADGHPHQPISDAAIAAERGRVDKLAGDFFKLVSKARSRSIDHVRGLDAGIFLGPDARRQGLVDSVMYLDAAVEALDAKATKKPKTEAAGNETDRRERISLDSQRHDKSRSDTSSGGTDRPTAKGAPMPVQLDALITKTKAAIAAETDPAKILALTSDLAAYAKAAKDCDDEDEDEEDDDEEKKSKKSSKASAKTAPAGAKKAAKKEEKKSEEDEEEEEEAKKAAAPPATLSALLGGLSGSALEGRLTAIIEKAEAYDALSADVAQMKADTVKSKRNALIDEAVAQRRITRHQAGELRTKKLAYVEQFLQMHPKALVNLDEESLQVPDGTPAADISANVKRIVEQAIAAQGLAGEAADKFRQSAYEDQRKAASRTEVH